MEYPNEVVVTERHILETIIVLYKDMPCLWDTTNYHYNNKVARDKAYELLLKAYRRCHPYATVAVMKKKLENLRTAFRREWKKVEASKTLAISPGQIYRPCLWYYDKLLFLVETPPKNDSVVDNEYSDDCGSPKEKKPCFSHEPEDPLQEDVITIKHNELYEPSSSSLMMDSVDESASDLVEESAADAFALSVGAQLKELTKFQRCVAEKMISEVIFYGKLEKLTIGTSINLNSLDT